LENFHPFSNRFWGQLLDIAHRTVAVKFSHSQRFSPRKLIPVNLKTTGDYLLLKRIKADLSQQELAVKSGVTVRKVKAWEHDQSISTEADWQVLAKITDSDKRKIAKSPFIRKNLPVLQLNDVGAPALSV
jgi:DNA-binding transcriptional regulator YiaG